LLVGQPVFHGGSVELVLAAQAAVLGSHPKHMLTHSELAHMYFRSDGRVYSIEPAGERRAGVMMPLAGINLKSLTKVEDARFLSFLTSLLSIDPEQRPTAAEALNDVWLQQALEPLESAEGSRHSKFLANVHGYQSPSTSRSGSNSNSVNTSPASSQNASRDSSPMRSPMRDGGDKGLSEAKSKSKACKAEQRRSGNPSAAGPGVPEEFRDAVQSDASRSHEWRQKLVRLVAPLSKDGRATLASPSAGASGANVGVASGDRPTSAGQPSGGDAAGKSWPSSFNMRSNKVADSPPPAEAGSDRPRPQQAGAPPLSSLHRPKMRL